MGVKATSLSFLRYLIPIGFGFVFFRLFSTVRDRLLTWRIYRALCRRAYPQLAAAHLDIFIAPFTGIAGSLHNSSRFVEPRAAFVHDLASTLEIFLGLVVFPITFVVYATTQLFRQSEPPYIAAIVVGVVTASLTAAGYWVYLALSITRDLEADNN